MRILIEIVTAWLCSSVCLYLHGVVSVFVVEHQRLLDQLVVSLQLVNVGLISNNDMLKLLQLGHLVLQGASKLQGAAPNFLWAEQMQQGQHHSGTINIKLV